MQDDYRPQSLPGWHMLARRVTCGMADPLSLLPYALAAGGGVIDGLECRQLVAAGLALRPRSALVTQALARGAAYLALPPGAAFLTALAACDGFPVRLLDPSALDIARTLTASGPATGVVFTRSSQVDQLPPGFLSVLLDESPVRAQVRQHDVAREVDLGAHFGLDLAGEREAEGQTEVCLLESVSDGSFRSWTHQDLLRAIRADAAGRGLTPLHIQRAGPSWHRVDEFVSAAAALYVGGRITTGE